MIPLSNYAKSLQYISLHPNCTGADLARELDITPKTAQNLIHTHRNRERLFISGWQQVTMASGLRWVAEYSVKYGKERDVKRPDPMGRATAAKRYRQRQRGCVNSVFALGTPNNVRRPINFNNRIANAQEQSRQAGLPG